MTLRGIGRGESFGRLLRFPLSMLMVAGLALGGERLAFAQASDETDSSVAAESAAPADESVGPAPLMPELDAAGASDEAEEEPQAVDVELAPMDEVSPAEEFQPQALAAMVGGGGSPDQSSIGDRITTTEAVADVPFNGSFGQSIAIEVPPFHGIEPHLSLSSDSLIVPRMASAFLIEAQDCGCDGGVEIVEGSEGLVREEVSL